MSCIPTEYRRQLYPLIPEYGYFDDWNALALEIEEDREYIAGLWANLLQENMNWFFGSDNSLEKSEGFVLSDPARRPKHFGLLEKWIPTQDGKDDNKWDAVKLILRRLKNLPKIDPSAPARNLKMNEVSEQKFVNLVKSLNFHGETKISPAFYRKWCSFVRSLNIVESYKHDGLWQHIKYDSVPSICFNQNKKQFEKHDRERFLEFLAQVANKQKVIKTSVLEAYQLVNSIYEETDHSVTNLQWQNFVEEMRGKSDPNNPFSANNSTFVADVSGSMTRVKNGIKPITVALSLAILGATLGGKPLYTFSKDPKKYPPIWTNLSDAVSHIQDENFNTDFKKLVDRLAADKVNSKTIYILTDGGFDEMCNLDPTTGVDYLQKKLGNVNLVFWNVDGKCQDFMASKQHENVCLLSGFSKGIYLSILNLKSFEDLNPEIMCFNILFSERYKSILDVVDSWP